MSYEYEIFQKKCLFSLNMEEQTHTGSIKHSNETYAGKQKSKVIIYAK